MAQIELKAADASDIAVLLPLVRAYHAFENIALSDAARINALAPLLSVDSHLGRIWLILSSGTVVGYIALCFGYSIEFGGRDAFLDEFFVKEEVREQGIGVSALTLVRQQAATLGIVALHLEVATTNETAKRLYWRAGFRSRERYHLMSCRVAEI